MHFSKRFLTLLISHSARSYMTCGIAHRNTFLTGIFIKSIKYCYCYCSYYSKTWTQVNSASTGQHPLSVLKCCSLLVLQHGRGRYAPNDASVTSSLAALSKNIPVTRVWQRSSSHELLKKMTNPAPAAKPGNPDNPRVFFDVDIGGERGWDLLIFLIKQAEWCMLLVYCALPHASLLSTKTKIHSQLDLNNNYLQKRYCIDL